ncbi:MAG: hypothetical protein HRU03_02240 [Nanoarchaeales archaeon]|nr:hypothetical protein [Nanoarchaeales archaeon]
MVNSSENTSNNSSDNTSFTQGVSVSYNLEESLSGYSKGITMISDLHSNWDGLEEALSHAASLGNDILIPGDLIGYDLDVIGAKLGYKTQTMLYDDYLDENFKSGNISQNTMVTYTVAKNNEMFGGIEKYIAYIAEQVPQEDLAGVRSELEAILENTNSTEFQEEFQMLNKNFENDKLEELQVSAMYLQCLQTVIWNESTKKAMQIKDEVDLKYGTNTNIFWLDGNHEPVGIANLFKEYTIDASSIIDLGEVSGYSVSFGGDKINESEDITMGGFSNVYRGIEKHNMEIYSNEQMTELFKHMCPDNMDQALFVEKNLSKDELKGLESKIKSSFEYGRITLNGEEIENNHLDISVFHGSPFSPIAAPTGGKNDLGSVLEGTVREGMEDIHSAVAQELVNISTLSVHGHLHHEMFGDNHLGKNFVRAAGQIYDVYKIDGELIVDKVKTNFTYNSHKTIDFDLDELKAKTDALMVQYGIFPAEAANDDTFSLAA